MFWCIFKYLWFHLLSVLYFLLIFMQISLTYSSMLVEVSIAGTQSSNELEIYSITGFLAICCSNGLRSGDMAHSRPNLRATCICISILVINNCHRLHISTPTTVHVPLVIEEVSIILHPKNAVQTRTQRISVYSGFTPRWLHWSILLTKNS